MLITVATFTSPWEAHIAKGRLEAEGITVYIADEHHIWVNWFYSQALGGVKLQVSDLDVPDAARVLSELSAGAFDDDPPERDV